MIKIVIDSTADLTKEEIQKLGLCVIPMVVRFEDKEYIAGEDLSNAQFYELLKKSKSLPQTAQINEQTYKDTIVPLLQSGYDVFAITISSALSGSYNSLRLASEEINSPHLAIFDSLSVTMALKVLVYEAVKFCKKSDNLQELCLYMEKLKTKCRLFAVVDNVKYLIKGGRLSKGAGFAATALNIKPIVAINNGKVEAIGKGIGFLPTLKAMLKKLENIDFSKKVCFGHSNDIKKFEILKAEFEKKFNYKVPCPCEIGPIIGTHAGPGCVGVAFIEK